MRRKKIYIYICHTQVKIKSFYEKNIIFNDFIFDNLSRVRVTEHVQAGKDSHTANSIYKISYLMILYLNWDTI